MKREEAIMWIKTLQEDAIFEINDALLLAIEALSKWIPAVQADRPHGEWIRISDDWIDGTCGARYFPIRCSVCGYSTYDDDATNFCPNCGAKMCKGGDEE